MIQVPPESQWTSQLAQGLGYSIWDAYCQGWGILDPAQPNSLEIPGSAYGMAIGPRSTVGRVFVNYTIPTPYVFNGLVYLWVDGLQVVSTAACGTRFPLLTPVSGPLNVTPAVQLAGPFMPFPQEYYPDGFPKTVLPFDDMELPALHLQVLLRNIPQVLIPIIRAPMIRQIGPFADPIADTNAEVFANGYPVMERQQARLHFRATTAGTIDFRVAALSQSDPGGNSLIERTLATISGVTGNATASTTVALKHDYLMVYYTVTSGPVNFQVDIEIIDDCCGPSVGA
jgi:hypothetical protein